MFGMENKHTWAWKKKQTPGRGRLAAGSRKKKTACMASMAWRVGTGRQRGQGDLGSLSEEESSPENLPLSSQKGSSSSLRWQGAACGRRLASGAGKDGDLNRDLKIYSMPASVSSLKREKERTIACLSLKENMCLCLYSPSFPGTLVEKENGLVCGVWCFILLSLRH